MRAYSTLIIALLSTCQAQLTIYNEYGTVNPHPTASASVAVYTGPAAFNPVELSPPPPPSPGTALTMAVDLTGPPNTVNQPIPAGFIGFSIELSVVDQFLGKNSAHLNVPFLNLMALLRDRSGKVYVRAGGNSQEFATVVEADFLPDGSNFKKIGVDVNSPSQTPVVMMSLDVLHTMAEISALVDVNWYLGIPFNDTSNWRLTIAEQGVSILGSHLAGFQAGNEPDFYGADGLRPLTYLPAQYTTEFGSLVNAVENDPLLSGAGPLLIGPSVGGFWTPDEVWVTGFGDLYGPQLAALAVERYPKSACVNRTSNTPPPAAQAELANYLTHSVPLALVQQYLTSTAYAQAQNKPLFMFETNTASCGGFPGLSDSFAAALWSVDWSLMLASSGFSRVLYHVGGEDASYDPFIPPPGNSSALEQWTVGPLFYSALVIAEALGPKDGVIVADIELYDYAPTYVVYEDGVAARMVLMNYLNAGNINVSVTVGGSVSQVTIKYLTADSVVQVGNFEWAGQTFGSFFGSDGRPKGTEKVTTSPCSGGTCYVILPGPSVAVVFLTPPPSIPPEETFATSVYTAGVTVTINQQVLATSNGQRAIGKREGSTSFKSGMSSGGEVSTSCSKWHVYVTLMISVAYTFAL